MTLLDQRRPDSDTRLAERFPDLSGLIGEVRQMLQDVPPDATDSSHDDLGYGFGTFSSGFLRHMGKRSLIGTTWPLDAGGRGLDVRALQIIFSMLAAAGAPAEAVFYVEAVGSIVVKLGNPKLQREILPLLLAGRRTVVEALSEPEAGSDLFSLTSRAERNTDGSFQVTGSKIWTSNGWTAESALVAVRTAPRDSGARGVSTLLLDLDSAGVSRRPILDARGDESFGEMSFTDVAVPAHRLVGEEGGGRKAILEALLWDRLWARFVKVPYLRSELRRLWSTCLNTEASQPVRARTESMLARLGIDIEVCAAMFDRCIDDLREDGRTSLERVSALKLTADQLGQSFFDTAQDILQPQVGTDPTAQDLERHFADLAIAAHGLLLAGGAPDIQRMAIAQRGLGMPRP